MPRGERWVWVFSGAASAALVAGAAALLRFPPSVPPAPAGAGSVVVQIARPEMGDGLLQDEAVLRDPRPLFLPTRFNASPMEPRREAGRTLFDLDRAAEEPGETDTSIVRELSPVAVLNGRPAGEASGLDALAPSQSEVGVVGLGRGEKTVQPLRQRGGYLQVFSAATGAMVLAEALAPGLAPAGGKDWEPMELFAVVDAAGLASPLVLVSSSTVDEVDAHFRRILGQVFRVGERLPPGFFRLVVGP
jgi:hypothetical protein